MPEAENYNVPYGKSSITFSLDRRDRKTLAIHVYPDKHVEVVAPLESSKDKILQKVQKRASWIIRQQLAFSRMQPQQPPPMFVNGETFRYLGRQYRVRIEKSEEKSVKLQQGRFLLSVPENTSVGERESVMLAWYRQRARAVFEERLNECVPAASVIGIKNVPVWRVKVMEKRWGSCTKSGTIYLNPELVAAPKLSIDYVIFHELCHLIEHNHSRRFYDLLTKVYPEWKRWRDYLNENIEVRLV